MFGSVYKHNDGENCWFDSCPEDIHWHHPCGDETTEDHCWKRCAVPKYIYRKLTESEKWVRKSCTSKRDYQNLEINVKQNWFSNLEKWHKEWTGTVVSVSSHYTQMYLSTIAAFLVSSHTLTRDNVRNLLPQI